MSQLSTIFKGDDNTDGCDVAADPCNGLTKRMATFLQMMGPIELRGIMFSI